MPVDSSIIDLAGGRQPLSNEDGSVWVAFNGELFEYPELRKDLLARGHRLSTRCDTEAWVHLYEDRGEGMFEKARGQFAVSLWDRNSRTLILGRDRVGICPLYYTEVDGWLLWGSEIKALLASGLVAARPDPRGIDHLFTFFCSGTTRTFFEGIESLPPGHFLRVRDGRVIKHRYWDLDFPDAGSERRLDDPTPMVEELEALLDAIRRAPAPERRAGRQLYQRRAGFDGRPGNLQPTSGRGDPLVHRRIRQGRTRRTCPRHRGGRRSSARR